MVGEKKPLMTRTLLVLAVTVSGWSLLHGQQAERPAKADDPINERVEAIESYINLLRQRTVDLAQEMGEALAKSNKRISILQKELDDLRLKYEELRSGTSVPSVPSSVPSKTLPAAVPPDPATMLLGDRVR